jgi:SAM-dependent methyltransferase
VGKGVSIRRPTLKPAAAFRRVVTDDRERWNEKYSTDEEFELPDDPIPELERRIDTLPTGRALDVATGTGRNARFLAAAGYDVDAVDVSDEALDRAERAADRESVEVNWIRSDLAEFEFEPDAYDVITVSFFATLERLPDLLAALSPGGVLVYEHHLRSSDDIEIGPSSDRYKFPSNHLLHACLDLTILGYEERTRLDDHGRTQAVATLVGRKSTGGAQSYPRLSD